MTEPTQDYGIDVHGDSPDLIEQTMPVIEAVMVTKAELREMADTSIALQRGLRAISELSRVLEDLLVAPMIADDLSHAIKYMDRIYVDNKYVFDYASRINKSPRLAHLQVMYIPEDKLAGK